MRTMSEEAELRMCDEDFGSEEEEGDVESYLEDNSSELMDRLRELEAENSALLLANESQREAYERCLDEVANHVVQALLNQKDLREECIKLKMLVFDLERQNRALCELFQQKLPNQQPAHCQVQAGPLPDCGASLHQDSAKQAEPPQTEAPAKGNGYRAPHAATPSSLEALSPFLRKKAHILEVLRRMEESDPLKFHPSSTSTSSSSSAAAALTFCDYSQVLVSTEAVLAAAAAAAASASTTASEPLPVQRAHRHCSCSEGDAHQLNGGPAPDPAPSATAAKPCSHHACCPAAAAPQGHTSPLEGVEPENYEKASAGACPAPEAAAATTAQHCDQDTASLADPEQDQDQDPDPRAGASVSPAPASCLSEVKAAAISSPSKLLKFLKLPSLAERRPPAPSDSSSSSPPAPPSRLSPQLTRTSRIPCRTNNYEVYHSPVPARRAATAERCRPPPPPPCRSESYPAPRSAPTSPPPPPPEDVATRTPATAVFAPTYENIPNDVITVAALPSAANRKLVKSLPDGVLSPALPQRRPASSPSSSSSSSEDEDDSDSPVWVSHHRLAEKDKGEGEEEEEEEPPSTPAPPPPPPPPPARRSADSSSSSIPKRPAGGVARPQLDSGHHAFQDRLAALGKLRGCDELQGAPRPAGASTGEEPRQPEAAVAAVAAVAAGGAGRVRGSGLKVPSGPRMGPPSPNADAPQVLRSNIRGPTSLHLKTPPPATGSSSSPNKIPPKSPSRPPTHQRAPRGPPEAPRYSSRSEERVKVGGKGRKNPVYGDSLPPPPPRPPPPEGAGPPAPATVPVTPTAMEQKVMKGIEENMLKLQEQDRGVAPGSEVKHKSSNGIASWFGLKKSKLPALSRRAAKDDKKEWKINIPSVGGARKEGVEGLNISTLMEKAEGLRRALEEERAYVERSGRGHSCEVVLDQSQGQLAVMYRGGGGGGGGVGGCSRSDNFMQQLLNRVDGKEVLHLPQRRLSFDCKASKFSQQGDILGMEKGSGRISKITSEENLSESVHSQRFAGSGASTYTLDSGIGTFPLPDCSGAAATRGLSKMRGGAEHSGSPGRAGRRARTLDRELPVQEERSSAYKQPGAGFQHGPPTAVVMREDKDAQGTNMFSQRTKTWTFPNLKAPAGPAEVYLAVEEEEEEPVSFGSPFRAGLKAGGPPSSSLPVPAQGPGMSRRGKTRAPSVPEVSREAGLELLRERPEEALSPSRPQVLETPESLSDSLYDSLSSCGSQG